MSQLRSVFETNPINNVLSSWWARARELFAWQEATAPTTRFLGAAVAFPRVLIEWGALVFGVLFFCQRILDFGAQTILSGNDTESLQQLDWVFFNAVKNAGTFPLWNPYFRTGWPFFADGFLHVYNPLSSLSVLFFGVWDGPKIAVILSYCAAAFGMWWLAKVLGLGSAARVWMGFSYALTGQPAARFFQGQYDFVYGYAWFPWAIGALIAIAQTRRRLYIGLAAIFMALIVFSGNAYYGFYMVFVALLLGIVAIVDVRRDAPRLSIRTLTALLLLLTGLLAIGLSAIQTVPLFEGRSLISKGGDPELATAHTFQQVWLDYTSPESQRPDTVDFPAREEYFAYVGLIPFILLLLTPLALWRGQRRWLIFFALLFITATCYAALKDMPLGSWYAQNQFWTQWRYPMRALVLGALALTVLGGMGIDAFWRVAAEWTMTHREEWLARAASWIARGFLVLLAVLMVLSVLDIAMVNRVPVFTYDACKPQYQAMAWLRPRLSGPAFVSNPQGCHGAVISQDLYYLDGWYGFEVLPMTEGMVNQRPVAAEPNYQLVGIGAQPTSPSARLVKEFDSNSIYRIPDSLPYAFSVENSLLLNHDTSSPIKADQVKPLAPYVASPNRVELIVSSKAKSTLVILNSLYPGWKVQVDGKSAPLLNVSSFMATPILEGVHKYEFVFDPVSFKLGLLLSVLSLVVTGILIARDVRFKLAVPRLSPTLLDKLRGLVPSPQRSRVFSPIAAALETNGSAPVASVGRFDLAGLSIDIRWRGLNALTRVEMLPWVLFGGALVIYAITRFVDLDKFPIYFFADEAIETVLARQLIEHGLRSSTGQWFPVFFDTYGFQNPLISVYVQVIASSLLGVSINASRMGPAFVTLLASGVLALILKLIFKIRYWWTGVLFLGIIPAWFLHSRTVFEAAMMASFYTGFLFCYLMYRYRSPRFIFGAVVFAALTFYSYGNGQLVIGFTAILLALSDIRYHLKQWRFVGLALVLGAILAFPYIQLRNDHPEEAAYHLRTLNTYLFQKIPLDEKIKQFAATYGYGLSPQYWFIPNEHDLARHRLSGYGNILIYTLPLFLIGVVFSLRHFRESRYRTLIIAALAAPIGGAITDIGVTRTLAFVIPAALFTAMGLDWLIARIRVSLVQRFAPIVVFAVLSFAGLFMLNDSLTNGPLWFRDYGLYGMQWGAEQLFQTIPSYLRQSPQTTVGLTSTWANGADVFIQYFMPDEPRVHMDALSAYVAEKKPLTDDMVFITTPGELKEARESGKFKPIKIEQKIKYPDGTDGFYFVRVAYVDNVDALFTEEKAARTKPETEEVQWNGETVKVTHSLFDMGRAINMLDDDTFTLARGLEQNPLLIEIEFPAPRPIKGLGMDFGSSDYELTVSLYADDSSEPVTFKQEFRKLPADPHVEMTFDNAPAQVKKVRILVHDLLQADPAHIHVREIKFK